MIGLYVHIPFCSKKCYYCDFASYEKVEYLMDEYIDAVLSELDKYKQEKFDTVFIGGGTPSYLEEKNLENLLRGISSRLKDSNILEFTIECNPGTINSEKLNIMKSYGVNRLSIGMQSANDDTLKFIGRVHSFDEFDKAFDCVHRVGFENINVDLIFAIPCETIENYKNTLDIVKSYDLAHISAYNLILEKNTEFYRKYKENKFKELDEDIQLNMYKYTKFFLENIGFKQYEISNYAKNGKKCLHNLIYWNFDDYVGIGVSAHSFYKGIRFENTRNIYEYIKMFKDNNHVYSKMYKNSLEDNIEEYVMLGLRKNEGINIIEFEKRFGINLFKIFENQIKKYTENRLLKIEDGRVFLTSEGIVLMNYILKDFIFE